MTNARTTPRSSQLAACLIWLAACSSCSAKVDDPPAQTSTAAATPEQFTPLPPAPGRFVDARGRISVPIPAGEGWECLEDQHGQSDAVAIAVRCRRSDPHEFLFLAAKTHRQPPAQRVDAETMLMSLYRANNEGFFARVEYTRSEPATLAGAPGWEAEMLAAHERLGEIRKRERLAIVGDRVFAISAEGSPALWEQHAEAMEHWFDTVAFAR